MASAPASHGENLPSTEWEDRFGVPAQTIRHRIRVQGWTPEEAVKKPTRAHGQMKTTVSKIVGDES